MKLSMKYTKLRDSQVIGGKILGAGGGGFMAFLVEPSKKEAVKTALTPLVSVDFKFETMILSDSVELEHIVK